jgi:hypothetical protein
VVKFRHSVLINPIQIQQKPDNQKACEPSCRKEAFGSITVKKDSNWINLLWNSSVTHACNLAFTKIPLNVQVA